MRASIALLRGHPGDHAGGHRIPEEHAWPQEGARDRGHTQVTAQGWFTAQDVVAFQGVLALQKGI